MVGGWVNSQKPRRAYIPFSAEVVESHLVGDIHAGMYPLLRGDMCRLLACDFDGPDSTLDALAYLDAAQSAGIPVALGLRVPEQQVQRWEAHEYHGVGIERLAQIADALGVTVEQRFVATAI